MEVKNNNKMSETIPKFDENGNVGIFVNKINK